MNDNSVIYKIECLPTGKVYIGQTQRSGKRRWYEHISDLRGNKHDNKHMQASFNKYGENAFAFSILEICVTGIDEKEKYWYEHYCNTLGRKKVFNARNIDKSSFGIKKVFTPEHKANMSQSRQKFCHTDEYRQKISDSKKGVRNKKKLKPYTLVDPDGYIHDVTDLPAFCKEHNLRRFDIYAIKSGSQQSTKGWTIIKNGVK